MLYQLNVHEYLQDEEHSLRRDFLVDHFHVFAEPVEDPSDRCRVEESH